MDAAWPRTIGIDKTKISSGTQGRFKSGYDENFEQVCPSCIVYYNFELDAKM